MFFMIILSHYHSRFIVHLHFTSIQKEMSKTGFLERIQNGENIIVAEGYLFEFERRGYLKAGSFVPQVVLEHPDLVKQLHQEYVHAGSDVVLAFTFYAHREKLRLVGKETEIEKMNRQALRIAREVADDTGTLMAGNICNSTVYETGNNESIEITKDMFKEQIVWAVEENADFIVAESFQQYGEAALALEMIQKYGNGLPAVVTIQPGPTLYTTDGVSLGEACKKLEDSGAAVVGLNCGRGPGTIIEALKEVQKVCKGPIAVIPVPYRTSPKKPSFFAINVPGTDIRAFPLNLPSCLCTREEIERFALKVKELGVQYVGLCCGNSSNQLRIISEVYGKHAPASDYAPDMEKHFIFGDQSNFPDYYAKDMRSKVTVVFE